MKAIPERAPVSDALRGVVIQVGCAYALALTDLPGAKTVAAGELVIRYGVRFLGKPEQYIVPGLVVLDYGDMLNGETAWEFLWHRSNLHPRAEVVGQREDDREDIVFFRALDLSLPPRVLVYQGAALVAPITALIATDPSGLPPRLLDYLPIHPTVEDWLLAQ